MLLVILQIHKRGVILGCISNCRSIQKIINIIIDDKGRIFGISGHEELESLKSKDNFYDYEKSFDQIEQELGRLYLENSLKEQSSTQDRRKKTLAKFGEIMVKFNDLLPVIMD
jgi:hypothetical protein